MTTSKTKSLAAKSASADLTSPREAPSSPTRTLVEYRRYAGGPAWAAGPPRLTRGSSGLISTGAAFSSGFFPAAGFFAGGLAGAATADAAQTPASTSAAATTANDASRRVPVIGIPVFPVIRTPVGKQDFTS